MPGPQRILQEQVGMIQAALRSGVLNDDQSDFPLVLPSRVHDTPGRAPKGRSGGGFTPAVDRYLAGLHPHVFRYLAAAYYNVLNYDERALLDMHITAEMPQTHIRKVLHLKRHDDIPMLADQYMRRLANALWEPGTWTRKIPDAPVLPPPYAQNDGHATLPPERA